MRTILVAAATAVAGCTMQPGQPTADPVATGSPGSSPTSAPAIGPAPGGRLIAEDAGPRLELRPPPTGAAPAPAPALAPVTTLAGEWRVAGIDGKDFNESYGLALSGSERELWWQPRCAGMARSYRIAGRTIEFGPPLDAPAPSATPAPVCAIGLPARLAEVMRAVDAAATVSRTPANGVLIAGGGRSLLLFSQ